MAFGDLFKNYPSVTEKLPTLRPEQLDIQNRALGASGSLLNQPSNFNFAPIEQKALQQFKTQTVPGLAERFGSTGGGLRSSAFRGALGGAASELQTNLAALGSEYGLRGQELQQNQLRNLLGYGLAPSFENIYIPSQQGPFSTLLGGVGQATLPKAVELAGGALQNYLNKPQHQQPSLPANAAQQLAVPAVSTAITAAGAAGFSPAILASIGGGSLALGGLAALAYLIYRKRKEGKENEARQAEQAASELEQHAQREATRGSEQPDLPPRNPGESIGEWASRAIDYRRKQGGLPPANYYEQIQNQINQDNQQGGQ